MNRRTIRDFIAGVTFFCVILLAVGGLALASVFLDLRQRVEALERAAKRPQAPVVLIQGPEPSPTPEPTHAGGGVGRLRGGATW